MATNEENTPRILSDERETRYIELSTQCEQNVYWHPSVTITLAAFSESGVMLHRMKSEETAVRFVLSFQEIQALISSYSAYVATHECRTPQKRSAEWFDELADPPVYATQYITLLLRLNLPRKPSFSQNVNHPNWPALIRLAAAEP